MLTTRAADGQLHSRAMNPIARQFPDLFVQTLV
jgi:hypothetical protein